jgi:hypothetical protein
MILCKKPLPVVTYTLIHTQHSRYSEIHNMTLARHHRTSTEMCVLRQVQRKWTVYIQRMSYERGGGKKIYIIPETKAYKNVGTLPVVQLITSYSHTNPWHL